MVVKKIGMPLMHIAHNCVMKFHIGLYDNAEEKPRDVIYTYQDEYVTINLNSFVTIEIKDKEEWDPSKSVMITPLSISQLIKGVDNLIASIYQKDTFEIVGGVTTITQDTMKQYTEQIVVGKNVIEMHPAVIYDKQEDVFYEGAMMYLNKRNNFVEMHYTRLEALSYNLKQINFVLHALNIFQFYLMTGQLKDFFPAEATKKRPPKINVFDPPQEIKDDRTIPVQPSMDKFF